MADLAEYHLRCILKTAVFEDEEAFAAFTKESGFTSWRKITSGPADPKVCEDNWTMVELTWDWNVIDFHVRDLVKGINSLKVTTPPSPGG